MIDLDAFPTREQRARTHLIDRAWHRMWQSVYRHNDHMLIPEVRFWKSFEEWLGLRMTNEAALVKWGKRTGHGRRARQ